MSTLVRRHPVGAFLVAVYAIALAAYAVPLLSSAGLSVLPIELPGIAPFLLLLTFGMVGVTFAVTAVVDGRTGVTKLRRRLFRFRSALRRRSIGSDSHLTRIERPIAAGAATGGSPFTRGARWDASMPSLRPQRSLHVNTGCSRGAAAGP